MTAGNALLHETLRRAGERIRSRCSGAFAGIQDRDAKRLVVVEQHAEELTVDFVTALVLGLQDQDAFLQCLVEFPVADEMKDVIGLAPKPVLERLQARAIQPLDRELPGGDPVRERLVQLRPLGFNIERAESRSGWRSSPALESAA